MAESTPCAHLMREAIKRSSVVIAQFSGTAASARTVTPSDAIRRHQTQPGPSKAIETAVMVARDAHGYGCGLFFFHAGTLAAGSVLIALLRFIRMVLMFVAKQLTGEGNDTGACVAMCLMCYVDCFRHFIC